MNARFGDARRQTKLQRNRTSNPGSGVRRRDPQIHATSRPWHTSSPGIRMNVSTLGQIAGTDPVRNKYLNRMKLGEEAQKKRGLDHKEEGRGVDKMGRAMERGLKHSVSSRRGQAYPNQERINAMSRELVGKQAEREAAAGGVAVPVADAVQPGDADLIRTGRLHQQHINAIKGMRANVKKHPNYLHPSLHHKYQN